MNYERGAYLGEVAFNDASFGRLLDHLERRGIADHTLVVLTSDHGEAFGEHGTSGHGISLFEENIHIPLIIRRPREPQPGSRVAKPVQLIDLFPTLLAEAGLPADDSSPGRSLFAEDPESDRLFFGHLKLDGIDGAMILQPPWKLIEIEEHPFANKRELSGLYHLEQDAKEIENLRWRQRERAEALSQRLAERKHWSQAEAQRVGGSRVVNADSKQVPDDLRQALEALGYLEPAKPEAQPERP